jgi:hypothetical protein
MVVRYVERRTITTRWIASLRGARFISVPRESRRSLARAGSGSINTRRAPAFRRSQSDRSVVKPHAPTRSRTAATRHPGQGGGGDGFGGAGRDGGGVREYEGGEAQEPGRLAAHHLVAERQVVLLGVPQRHGHGGRRRAGAPLRHVAARMVIPFNKSPPVVVVKLFLFILFLYLASTSRSDYTSSTATTKTAAGKSARL